MLKFFHAQKNDIDLSKIFSWEYIFIKSSYYERKKEKKKIPPHPTPPKNYFLENKKNPNLPTLKNNQTSPSHATQKHNPLK